MKLKEVAEIIKGAYLTEGSKESRKYKELTMMSLEPISFIDERKLIEINSCKECSNEQFTKTGDVIVSLYYPVIACFVEEEQEGIVVPHHMAIIRLKSDSDIDSRFIVQFINSTRGRRALCHEFSSLYSIRPTNLPLQYLNNVDILDNENSILESY